MKRLKNPSSFRVLVKKTFLFVIVPGFFTNMCTYIHECCVCNFLHPIFMISSTKHAHMNYSILSRVHVVCGLGVLLNMTNIEYCLYSKKFI